MMKLIMMKNLKNDDNNYYNNANNDNDETNNSLDCKSNPTVIIITKACNNTSNTSANVNINSGGPKRILARPPETNINVNINISSASVETKYTSSMCHPCALFLNISSWFTLIPAGTSSVIKKLGWWQSSVLYINLFL